VWIVRLALRRPYPIVIIALLIVLVGAVTIVRTPSDIFPEVNIPVVSVIWSLTGTSVTDMEARIVTPAERAYTTSVNDIEHIESQSMPGVGVIKVFFHPNTQIGSAIAEVTAVSQQLLGTSPAGTTPPLILQYNASSVPILHAAAMPDASPGPHPFDTPGRQQARRPVRILITDAALRDVGEGSIPECGCNSNPLNGFPCVSKRSRNTKGFKRRPKSDGDITRVIGPWLGPRVRLAMRKPGRCVRLEMSSYLSRLGYLALRAVFRAIVHHSKSSIIVCACLSSSASPLFTSPPRKCAHRVATGIWTDERTGAI
jgi:hypothetical protein